MTFLMNEFNTGDHEQEAGWFMSTGAHMPGKSTMSASVKWTPTGLNS